MMDVVVIGGGPSGLAAASEIALKGYEVMILERDDELGGLLQQCIHDGFGTILFNESLSGPEFADRFIEKVKESNVDIKLETYVKSVDKKEGCFELLTVTPEGVHKIKSRSIVYAIGCRERNRFEIKIGGTRPAGVYTAGTVQRLVNLYGVLPGKDPVIVGGGDVGLIVARHLYLEGVDSLLMVYPEDFFSGLPRNAQQCILDFDIPYRNRTTVKRIIGDKKIEGVELVEVDKNWEMIPGTEEICECDSVILSVGLIPYSEKVEELGAEIDKETKGPVVNEYYGTTVEGVFSVGNLVQIFDYVDDAVKTAYIVADGVDKFLRNIDGKRKKSVKLVPGDKIRTVTPQRIDYDEGKEVTIFFRPDVEKENAEVCLVSSEKVIKKYRKKYIRPSTLEEIKVPKGLFDGEKEVIIYVL